MDSYSTVEPEPRAAGNAPAASVTGELNPEEGVQPGTNRTSQANVSSALAAAGGGTELLGLNPRFPGEDAGRSLAAMAQRDLDAALQLLADRAQYITGAQGAAIALRRGGRNDMQCRASTGSNAPEVGALLSTEFGLSGESVRTRRALRCDDAERDARVNREVCRQLGIASVVVMPVVHDDEVLGVFELFSGKAHAFGERDLSALQRLSEMVETAVRLARVTETLPERLRSFDAATSGTPAAESLRTNQPILGTGNMGAGSMAAGKDDGSLEEIDTEVEVQAAAKPEVEREAEEEIRAAALSAKIAIVASAASESQPKAAVAQTGQLPTAPGRTPLMWSAARGTTAGVQDSAQGDESQVPAALRHLKKCEVCGFPISATRSLCVECEEKRWRGQLRRPVLGDPLRSTAPAVPAVRAAGVAAAAAVLAPERTSEVAPAQPSEPDVKVNKSNDLDSRVLPERAVAGGPRAARTEETGSKLAPLATRNGAPELVLSAGLQPSQSWISANKYILGALLVVAGIVSGILLLR